MKRVFILFALTFIFMGFVNSENMFTLDDCDNTTVVTDASIVVDQDFLEHTDFQAVTKDNAELTPEVVVLKYPFTQASNIKMKDQSTECALLSKDYLPLTVNGRHKLLPEKACVDVNQKKSKGVTSSAAGDNLSSSHVNALVLKMIC